MEGYKPVRRCNGPPRNSPLSIDRWGRASVGREGGGRVMEGREREMMVEEDYEWKGGSQ